MLLYRKDAKSVFFILIEEKQIKHIEIKCFCDSDFLKWGKNIYRDTICLSKEEIKKYNNELLIIVAIEDSDALVESLKNDGFEKIYNFKKIEWMKLKAKFEKFILENDIEDLKEKIYKNLLKNKLKSCFVTLLAICMKNQPLNLPKNWSA